MALLTVWPTDGADGSVADEARWRKMARLWSPSGVRAGVGSEMVPTLAGLNLTVRSGGCWIDGHYCELGTDQVLPVTADGLAVVRFDPVANTAELLWRAGTGIVPTMNPSGVWELPIAVVGSSFMADRRMFVMDNGLAAFSSYARDLNLPSPPNGVEVFHRDNQMFSHRLGGLWQPLKKLLYAFDFAPAVSNYVTPNTVDLFFSSSIPGVVGLLPFPITVVLDGGWSFGYGGAETRATAWLTRLFDGARRDIAWQSASAPVTAISALPLSWTYNVAANTDWGWKLTVNGISGGGYYTTVVGRCSIYTQ